MSSFTVTVTAEFSDPELAERPLLMLDLVQATGASPYVIGKLFQEYNAPQTGVGLAMVLTGTAARTLNDALRLTKERDATSALIVSHRADMDDVDAELDTIFGPSQPVEEEE